ncbi:hypothetical protein F6J84_03660 [Microbacterium caowuchunii]|uniref:hypothetical protein n=1 Tax=Microbacterium caowuchunii TaxID=2614638 RepID=UPI00124537B9|nr:hypothetical protein [Microbacterium caowuchunii]QEV99301.1 hypothetical protein F6J84_03660 [Microbacterium caowuchunii]
MSAQMIEIVVQGTLGEALGTAIGNFRVARVENGRTHLIGPVPDQARLQGILTQLSSLNIPLISVNPLN